MTSRRKADCRSARERFRHAFNLEIGANREEFGSEDTRMMLNEAMIPLALLCGMRLRC